jgi:hypothetical protein
MNAGKICEAVFSMTLIAMGNGLSFNEGKLAARALLFAIEYIDDYPQASEEETLAQVLGFIRGEIKQEVPN